ncbi:hypothetical protein [Actinoplanes couchii]|uniref:Uncharacterized protein n=1 Tax=Actinoplanes couchii TaxID=403638 RepID=A0ABQ3XMK6_9ACTN|nr:hypothetical protein [Actinoplanes couchii]MDR6321648.1 GrpB-like predicted nucleotidyltransferase (UPF0157 family) [Actinoplanes couchii]GID59744.1 hypothetical protein Aco03nite_081480 [Actinoplanes couchii]
MHDEMITHFDECIARMLQLRASLAATRRVEPGERHDTVRAAIAAAERFAVEAGQTLTNLHLPVRVGSPATAPVLSTAVGSTAVGFTAVGSTAVAVEADRPLALARACPTAQAVS